MITGRRAFRGGSKISVLAGILREEPPSISSLSAGVPLDLEKIVARCLRKDPARRYQHMDDVRIALEDLKRESESGTTLVVRPATGRKWRWPPPEAPHQLRSPPSGCGAGARRPRPGLPL